MTEPKSRWDRVFNLFRGYKGHPFHPPMTDASIGAYTVGALIVLGGWMPFVPSWLEEKMAWGGFLAIAGGLLFALPTVVTGFVDYIRIPRGTGMRRVANFHWVVMVLATSSFLVTEALLQKDFDQGRISGTSALGALVAFALMGAGGYIGGTIVFEYGMRVQNQPPEAPARETLKSKWPPD